jgi:hypothetical protein
MSASQRPTPSGFGVNGIVAFRIDTRKEKFIMTPIMGDGSEAPIVDATDMHEKFLREQGR